MPPTRSSDTREPRNPGTGPRTVIRELVTAGLPPVGAPFPAADRERLFRALVASLDVLYGPTPFAVDDVTRLHRDAS